MDTPIEVLLGERLKARGLTLATAESCTGGLVGDRITNVSGSSDYYLGAVVAYAYQAKVDLLGVSWETLNTHGAVSAETVREMAAGARKAFKADLAVSISGIAGPTGGTPEKPVGTVWFGLETPDGVWTRRHHFSGNRIEVKQQAAAAAIQFVLDYLEGELGPAD
ncbi:MAG: CinA family protein [Anaerolineales bacterium]|nr:CinA family protein [Anaerolineales bacterium]